MTRTDLEALLLARRWFEGNPEGALDEIEHRVRKMLGKVSLADIPVCDCNTSPHRKTCATRRTLPAEGVATGETPITDDLVRVKFTTPIVRVMQETRDSPALYEDVLRINRRDEALIDLCREFERRLARSATGGGTEDRRLNRFAAKCRPSVAHYMRAQERAAMSEALSPAGKAAAEKEAAWLGRLLDEIDTLTVKADQPEGASLPAPDSGSRP